VPLEGGDGLGGGGDVLGGGGDVLDGGGEGVPLSAVTRSWGRLADSRLARLVAVTLVEVRAKLMGSFPETSAVTSHSNHEPAAMAPEESVIESAAGMFSYVSVVSLHALEATPRTSMLSEFALLAKTRSLAPMMEAPRPSGSNLRNARTSGEPSVRRVVDVPKLRFGSTLVAYVSATAAKVDVVGVPEAPGVGGSESWAAITRTTAGSARNKKEALSVFTDFCLLRGLRANLLTS
jgi:hypothetical protein